MRRASRFRLIGVPVWASKTTTPTGDVSTRASRSARARCSSRWVRALAIAVAACDANSTRTSSSSSVNGCPASFSPRKKLPTCSPPWRIGMPCKVFDRIRSAEKPSERTKAGRSDSLSGPGRSREGFEQARPVGPAQELIVLFRREAGRNKLLYLPRFVDGRDTAVACVGQRAGAVHDFLEDCAHVEARADAQHRGT